MTRPHYYLLYFLAFISLLYPISALAQGQTTTAIVGQVTDATHAAVPGAMVTITDQATGLKRVAKTNEEGQFNFPQLRPGSYSVRVAAQGFEIQQQNNVSSGLGQKQTVNFVLKVAPSEQTVQVNTQPPLLNPENANTTSNLDSVQLENLPNPGAI